MYSIYKKTPLGERLNKSLYRIDEKNKTFSTEENDIIIDFKGLDGWNFSTGFNCFFSTGSDCTFETGNDCSFGVNDDFKKIKTGRNSNISVGKRNEWAVTCFGFSILVLIVFLILKVHSFSIILLVLVLLSTLILIFSEYNSATLDDEVEVYFNKENNEILYTENKLTKDEYLRMKEREKREEKIEMKKYREEKKIACNENGLEYCMVRTSSTDTWVGYVENLEGKIYILRNARLIKKCFPLIESEKFSKSEELFRLATEGSPPYGCTIQDLVDKVTLTEVIEIIPITEKAKKLIEEGGLLSWDYIIVQFMLGVVNLIIFLLCLGVLVLIGVGFIEIISALSNSTV